MDADKRKELFIERAKEIHKNENLDYSFVEYKNNRTPVKIIDHDLKPDGTEYGEFWQTPSNHLKGQSHPLKKNKKISLSKRNEQEQVIERFKKIHYGENLDYSQVNYVNMHTKVKIISHDLRPDGTEYGEFWQEPCVHLKGCTHPEIGKEKQIKSIKYTTEIFIDKAKKVQNKKYYNYSKVDYKSSQEKVCIICEKIGKNGKPHGEFWINPDAVLQGKGCPKCGNQISKSEDEIYDYIKNTLGFYDVQRNVSILDGKEIDIYIPSKKIGFEFNGIKWHSDEYKHNKFYHLEKTNIAKSKGITLIHIFEDEFLNKKNIVLDKISTILFKKKFSKKIYGRNVNIQQINKDLAKCFLNENHIQGFVSSTKYFGAFNNNELIAVMTFLNEKNGKWCLSRYSTNINYLCPGVASKILKYFIDNENPVSIKSFLDLRWCSNVETNLYTKLGFKAESISGPDYKYTNGYGKRIHKFNFRKQKLHRKYGLPLTMTEKEMAINLGYYRIWDCGLIKYVWKKEA